MAGSVLRGLDLAAPVGLGAAHQQLQPAEEPALEPAAKKNTVRDRGGLELGGGTRKPLGSFGGVDESREKGGLGWGGGGTRKPLGSFGGVRGGGKNG